MRRCPWAPDIKCPPFRILSWRKPGSNNTLFLPQVEEDAPPPPPVADDTATVLLLEEEVRALRVELTARVDYAELTSKYKSLLATSHRLTIKHTNLARKIAKYKPTQPDTPKRNTDLQNRFIAQEGWMEEDRQALPLKDRVAELEAQNAEVDLALAHMTKLRNALMDPNDA
jgi:hypothetical protein